MGFLFGFLVVVIEHDHTLYPQCDVETLPLLGHMLYTPIIYKLKRTPGLPGKHAN